MPGKHQNPIGVVENRSPPEINPTTLLSLTVIKGVSPPARNISAVDAKCLQKINQFVNCEAGLLA
jgi:hypothetical protein